MSETSFFTDMLQSITDRGRKLLFSGSRVADVAANADTETLCEMLLSSRGEASGMALAAEILDRWSRLDTDGARQFFVLLSEKFGPDTAKLEQAIETYLKEQSSAAVIGLHQAAEPRRQELLRRLNQAPSGTARLVRMREQLLRLKEKEKGFQALDADFTHLFSSWFNRGFLSLRPIEWSTQANILEKIIAYEAVHEIAGWEELRRRLAPSDRRCFAFFHPRLADEPLVFVEVALTRAVPANIHDVLDETREQIAADEATTAVFYSISNCQDGLRGISFGNFLIKQVVDDLKKELPGLTNFVTLSPVPGFARWLSAIRTAEDDPALSSEERATLSAMDKPSWSDDAEVVAKIERIIVPMAAHYFFTAKTADGRPIDPVARFHLGNGARLERLNFLGDRSPKAMKQAHGLMVNYLYKLDDIVANHEALAQRGEVAASPVVRTLLKQRGDLKTAANTGGFQSRPRKS